MIRFRRLVCGLLFILVTVLVGVRLMGSTHLGKVAALFTNPDGSPCQRPCLFGIRTAETTKAQAVILLKSHPLTRNLTLDNTALFEMSSQGSPAMRVSFDTTSDGLVDWVSLYVPASPMNPAPKLVDSLAEPVSLGDILAEAGGPEWLGTQYGHDYLHIPTAQLMVGFLEQPSTAGSTAAGSAAVATSTVITDLALSNPHTCPQGDVGEFKPWLGFASKGRYEQAADVIIPNRRLAGPHTVWVICLR